MHPSIQTRRPYNTYFFCKVFLILNSKEIKNHVIGSQPSRYKKSFGNWRENIVNWYKDLVVNGSSAKNMHLYLYGRPKKGKTKFLQHLVSNWKAFYKF